MLRKKIITVLFLVHHQPCLPSSQYLDIQDQYTVKAGKKGLYQETGFLIKAKEETSRQNKAHKAGVKVSNRILDRLNVLMDSSSGS